MVEGKEVAFLFLFAGLTTLFVDVLVTIPYPQHMQP
jgi:hypothetical protein